MFPYRVAGKHDFRAYGTFSLIVVMFLAFAWEINFAVQHGKPMENYFPSYAFVPCQVGMQGLDHTLVDGVRSLFMHVSFTQLLTNAVFLWIFGPAVESYFGHKRFIAFFFVVGFGGWIATALFLRGSGACDPLVGPSSAIPGIMAAFLFLYPARRIETYVPVLARKFDLPALFFVAVYFALSVFVIEKGPLSGEIVSFWDEGGGFITGLLFIFAATMLKPAPPVNAFEHLDR
jgi:membrane associated rhomboid family serine protease